MNAVEIKDLVKQQGAFTLDISGLNIPIGYIIGVIGENGAGKTTFINQLLDLNTNDQGVIKVFGKNYHLHREEILSKIGVVFSSNHYPEWMSPKQIEKILNRYYQNFDTEVYQAYLQRFEVPYKMKLKHMSQGMQVKFNLVAALSHQAELLILDEPTSNLDPTFRVELLNIFQDLMLDENRTILFSTHNTSDLDNIADYIVFMDRGTVKLFSEKDELKRQYYVVKGPEKLLDDELAELLVGCEFGDNGFVGMTKDIQVFKELFGNQITSKPITFDEFMYFNKKERLKGGNRHV